MDGSIGSATHSYGIAFTLADAPNVMFNNVTLLNSGNQTEKTQTSMYGIFLGGSIGGEMYDTEFIVSGSLAGSNEDTYGISIFFFITHTNMGGCNYD